MGRQRKAAKLAMENWLAAEGEKEKHSFEIENTAEFELYDLHYYVFRFKTGMSDEWMLGVAGGYEKDSEEHNGHIFSEFKGYQENTAIEDAIRLVEYIRAYCIKEEKRLRYERCFEENMEYISQEEIPAQIIEKQFINDKKHRFVLIGNADFPTGRVVLADPLAYLPSGKYTPELKINIKEGTYPVYIATYENEDIGIRMCTTKLKLKDSKAVRYLCAEETEESSIRTRENEFISGFPVDAGMMTICDAKVALEYRKFLKNWYEENPDKNHYDDYFASYFMESYKKFPDVQRKSGDFIEWKNPENDYRMIMTSSGFGDGFYQGYIGYDEEKEMCEIIVPMINPELFEKEG